MASSSRPRRRGQGGNSMSDSSAGEREQDLEPNVPNEADPIVFSSPAQEAKYYDLLFRPRAAQKFADIPTLRRLHIYDQIRKLFSNVGWEGVLSLNPISYTNPTVEFLSSVRFHSPSETLFFRLFNREHHLTIAQICELVGAPSDRLTTFKPSDPNSNFRPHRVTFWHDLTGLDEYDSKGAKASRIIHPVLRIAHRLICEIFFPQEETSKCGMKEMEILWSMVNGPDKTPNFGHWIISKLLKLAKSTNRSQVHCGGIVTLLAGHPALGIEFPDGLEIMRGERALTVGVLQTMSILRVDGRTVYWKVGRADYLAIDSRNHRTILKLGNPVYRTDWTLPSNIGAVLPQPVPPHAGDEEQERPRTPPHPDTGTSTEHAMSMAEFQRLHGSIRDLHRDYTHLYADVEANNTLYHELSLEVHDHFEEQRAHNTRVDAYMAEQRAHNASMLSLMSGFQQAHIGPSQSFYPSNQQNPPPPGTHPPCVPGPYPPYPPYPHYPPPPPFS